MSISENVLTKTDSVANELLNVFISAWTDIFDLPASRQPVDTINQNTAVIVYHGDGQSSNAKLMQEFFVKYDLLMRLVYGGNEVGLDLAIAWSGRLHPNAQPSAQAIIMLHPAIADRFEDDHVAELWAELGLDIFVMADDDEGPMGRWHEAARSIVVGDPCRSVPGRKWFVISSNPEIAELDGQVAA